MLDAAGIPSYVDIQEVEPDKESSRPSRRYLVMVPPAMSLRAWSVLNTEIYNAQEEDGWRAYFEALSDRDLRSIHAEDLVQGFLDAAKRLRHAYESERVRRES